MDFAAKTHPLKADSAIKAKASFVILRHIDFLPSRWDLSEGISGGTVSFFLWFHGFLIDNFAGMGYSKIVEN